MSEVIDLSQKFSLFSEHWQPRIVAQLNESYVKLAKLEGEFVWHRHDHEDELFLVVRGSLVIKLRERDLSVGEGQLVVIPKGVEHMPVAAEEVHVLLVEPMTTRNTGELQNERTIPAEWL